MIQTELAQLWQQPDPTQYAAMSFLARYRGATLRAYTQDLRYFLRWCTERGVEPLLVERPHGAVLALDGAARPGAGNDW